MNPNGARTAGEIIFQQYLAAQNLPFSFEQEYPGKSKRPDYTLRWKDKTVVFDVKDFVTQHTPSASCYALDLYTNIREKIEQGRRKFKEFKESCCGLVLYNAGDGIVMLEEPDIMLGSMYGDSGFTFPVNTETGVGDSSRMERAFLGGGKMLRPNRETPQNTTISAVITLSQIRPHHLRLLDMVHEYPEMSVSELEQEAERTIPDYNPNHQVPRVIVWHNAVARIEFPEDLFRGPYDTHFGAVPEDDGVVQRVTYRGALLPPRVKV
jgi:hypothetical protein